jgi:hypothetical protein
MKVRSINHVDVLSERDALPHGMAGGPLPGSVSRRYAPRSTVTQQIFIWVLLVCLGLLLGTSWTTQALQPKLRKQAEERRRLNEEWSLLRAARRQRSECPRCATPLSGWWDWYYAPTIVEDRSDEL